MISILLDKFFYALYRDDKNGHIFIYTSDDIIIKSGHIPLVAYRILEGTVEVFEGDRFIGKYGAHTCWGMNEIMNERPSPLNVIIKKGTKVCTIGKSELQKTWIKLIYLFEYDMLEKISEQK